MHTFSVLFTYPTLIRGKMVRIVSADMTDDRQTDRTSYHKCDCTTQYGRLIIWIHRKPHNPSRPF